MKKLDYKKKSLGQFFTIKDIWLKPHILEFIKKVSPQIVFDPFAGKWDLLKLWEKIWIEKILWLDIDPDMNWPINDSLISIPKIEKSIIITNPPYITKYSAKRKNILHLVEKYFKTTKYDDLYKLAIEKCMENNDYWILIVPETFINSNFPKSRLVSITIIEEKIFNDTDIPICIICFDKNPKDYKNIHIYKNEKYIWDLLSLEQKRLIPTNEIDIKFNCLKWQIALRAIDMVSDENIKFLLPEDINYDLETIKHSSRLITLIQINIENNQLNSIINISNKILNNFRKDTDDILLSPFKWNNKNWIRRRRLDYKTARAILEQAYSQLNNKNLFS